MSDLAELVLQHVGEKGTVDSLLLAEELHQGGFQHQADDLRYKHCLFILSKRRSVWHGVEDSRRA
jgi:hypothetical protein